MFDHGRPGVNRTWEPEPMDENLDRARATRDPELEHPKSMELERA